MSVGRTVSGGAVLGAPLDTTPTRKAILGTGALGTLGSIGLTVFGLAAKNPTVVKEVTTIVGGAGGLGSVFGMIAGWIRTAEAEVEHALTVGEGEVSQVTGVPVESIHSIVTNAVTEALKGMGLTQSVG